MKIRSQQPTNKILRDAIRCIYVIEQDADGPAESFLIFPSVSAYLSISLDTVSTVENDVIAVEATSDNRLDSSLQLGLKSSSVYKYRGPLKEVCIVFNPLSVFDFFDEETIFELSCNGQPFIPDEGFETAITSAITLSDDAEMLAQLESYFLSRYHAFRHPYLSQAVAILQSSDTEGQLAIEALAGRFNITRQTLSNQFRKYVNLSASEFRQISRFRNFVNARLSDERGLTLTEFAHDLGFFDQSHLIKEFRKYTLLKPNDVFRKLDRLSDNNILVIWQ